MGAPTTPKGPNEEKRPYSDSQVKLLFTFRRRPELPAKPNAMPGKIRLSMQYKVICMTLGRGKDSLKMKFQPVNAIRCRDYLIINYNFS